MKKSPALNHMTKRKRSVRVCAVQACVASVTRQTKSSFGEIKAWSMIRLVSRSRLQQPRSIKLSLCINRFERGDLWVDLTTSAPSRVSQRHRSDGERPPKARWRIRCRATTPQREAAAWGENCEASSFKANVTLSVSADATTRAYCQNCWWGETRQHADCQRRDLRRHWHGEMFEEGFCSLWIQGTAVQRRVGRKLYTIHKPNFN